MNPRVAALPQYHGFPIPYFAKIRTDGTPDFKITDEARRTLCAIERRCWVCGQILGRFTAFLGGPKSIGYRLFVDGPMHRDCAQDAMAICPFMLGRMDYATTFQPERHSEPVAFARDRPDQQQPPEQIGLLISPGFDIATHQYEDSYVWFFRALLPNTIPIIWQDRTPGKEPHGSVADLSTTE